MDRVAFNIFGIDVMWYGILMATGMILGTIIALREAKRVGIKEDDVRKALGNSKPLITVSYDLHISEALISPFCCWDS